MKYQPPRIIPYTIRKLRPTVPLSMSLNKAVVQSCFSCTVFQTLWKRGVARCKLSQKTGTARSRSTCGVLATAARVAAVLDIVKQMAPNTVSILPAFSQKSFKIQRRCRVQCCPVSVSRCVRSEPIRDAAALVSGPPCNLAVGEALLAQSLKRGKYFLTGLSVLQAGSAVSCRSAGYRIFGENGSNMGVAINAHLFLDRRPEILDQMKTVSHLARLRCALPGCLSIQATAISANNFDRRTFLQPCFCALNAAVVQNIDDRLTLKIDHDRP